MTDLKLHDVLSRASEGQDAPELVLRAVVTANRRLARRRRGAAAAVATAVVVAGVVLVPRLAGPAPEAVDEPSVTPSPSAPDTPDIGPSPDYPDTDPATQPVWDPASIETAPLRATNLPERIDLEAAQGPALQAQPMSGIVTALAEDHGLRLLDTDGTWRTVSLPAIEGAAFGVDDGARPAISSDGTRVAVATDAGIRVIDATSGTEFTLPWPARFTPPWDTPPNVEWQPGDDGFIVFDIVRTWLVELDGSNREAPYRSYALGIDPEGPVYQNDFEASTLVTWEGDHAVDESPLVQCERMVAGYGMVACTAGSLQPSESGPVVLDPATGKILAYAPIKDRNAVYSDNGHLTLLGFLDENTLLMLVGPATFHDHEGAEEWFLALWQFRTGAFERISTGDAEMRSMAVTSRLLD